MNMIGPKLSRSSCYHWHTDMVILLGQGVSVVEACESIGVSRATFYRHLKSHSEFKLQVDRARSMVSAKLFKMVHESTDWRASAWILEKLFPGDYGTVSERLRYHGCRCGAAARIGRKS